MPDNRLERFAHNLDWNLLRTFVVVVEEGSITAAANRLLLQQPARQHGAETVGTDRRPETDRPPPGPFRLDGSGRKAAPPMPRHLCRSGAPAECTGKPQGDDITGHVSIHSVSHAHNPAWDRKLESFFRLYPKATLSITVETTVSVISAVERNIATIGLCDGNIPDALGKTFHIREQYGLYCGWGHRLFGVEGAALNALRGDPYIAFIADVLGGQHMNAITAVRAMGSFGQQVRAVSCNVEEVLRLIAANIGIGMVPDHLAAPGLAAGDLWQLPPYELLPTTDVFRITNPNAILNPAETAFLRHVAETEPLDHSHQHQSA